MLPSVEIESPHVSWDKIGGLDSSKQTLQESVERALLHPEVFRQTQQTQANIPRHILLCGPTGSGKTLLAKAAASQAKANFICASAPELLSGEANNSGLGVKELFAKARLAAPCVVFIDEIDSLAPAKGNYRGNSGAGDSLRDSYASRVLGQLLAELDGLQIGANILVICAAKRWEVIDSVLVRSGRLDLHLKMNLPDLGKRLEILKVHNQNRPLYNVDLADLAAQTEGWNGAELALLSNLAALEAMRCCGASLLAATSIQITAAHFKTGYEQLAKQRKFV